jgi:hypothetical protein
LVTAKQTEGYRAFPLKVGSGAGAKSATCAPCAKEAR